MGEFMGHDLVDSAPGGGGRIDMDRVVGGRGDLADGLKCTS